MVAFEVAVVEVVVAVAVAVAVVDVVQVLQLLSGKRNRWPPTAVGPLECENDI